MPGRLPEQIPLEPGEQIAPGARRRWALLIQRMEPLFRRLQAILNKLDVGGPGEVSNFCDVLYIDCANGFVGVGEAPGDLFEVYKSSGVARIQIISEDSVVNLRLLNQTATPAADTQLGRVSFRGLDDGGNVTNYGTIAGYVEGSEDGSEDGYVTVEPTVAGTRTEMLRADANGVDLNGLRVHGALSSAPSSPSAGDIYYDTTTNKHRGYNGSSWSDFY